jgi:hypothetical protein
MKINKILMVFLLLFVASIGQTACPKEVNGINIEKASQDIALGKFKAYIHSSLAKHRMFSVTYRSPNSFFSYLDFSLVPGNKHIAGQLSTLNRHDYIQIQGELLDLDPCFPHIKVQKIKLLNKYNGMSDLKKYQHKMDYSKLFEIDEFIGKVHFVSSEMNLIVMEYGDLVLPVFIEKNFAKSLDPIFRGDILKIKFVFRLEPDNPGHIELDLSQKSPLQIIKPMVAGHGDEVQMSGTLVRFPKSPQIKFDIFALKVKSKHLIQHNFTLVNFKDFKLFQEILKKLDQIWKEKAAHVVRGRNYLMNPKIKLRVSGIKNVVSRSQANPQIIINRLEDIELIELE